MKYVLQAREEELASVKYLLQARGEELESYKNSLPGRVTVALYGLLRPVKRANA